MLLACAGIKSAEALKAITALLQAGAVPDTWAPNGSSALMLAAAVDSVEAIRILLDNGATVELQVCAAHGLEVLMNLTDVVGYCCTGCK